MARKIAATLLIVRAWDIDGFPNYFFGADNELYRYDSRGAIHKNKRLVLRYTQGYSLCGRFYSLSQLRPLLRRHVPTYRPADF